ncbi:hypothetical protein K435DRAFT_842731, partial [Dendrothele bispora CBS 962.96]
MVEVFGMLGSFFGRGKSSGRPQHGSAAQAGASTSAIPAQLPRTQTSESRGIGGEVVPEQAEDVVRQKKKEAEEFLSRAWELINEHGDVIDLNIQEEWLMEYQGLRSHFNHAFHIVPLEAQLDTLKA